MYACVCLIGFNYYLRHARAEHLTLFFISSSSWYIVTTNRRNLDGNSITHQECIRDITSPFQLFFRSRLPWIRVLSVWGLMQIWNPRASSCDSFSWCSLLYIPCLRGITAGDSSRLIFLVQRMWTRMSVLLPTASADILPSSFFFSCTLTRLPFLFASAYREIFGCCTRQRLSTWHRKQRSVMQFCRRTKTRRIFGLNWFAGKVECRMYLNAFSGSTILSCSH